MAFCAAVQPHRETPTAAASAFVRWGYPLLGLSLMALYVPTLARGATFSDGPEIATAIKTLGVAHPTGYPIFTVLAHLFGRLLALPLLDVVKIELFNALCATLGAVLTAYATRDIALLPARGAPGAHRHDAAVGGLVAGALLGTSPLLWAQVRIPEVYPFHFLLVAWTAHLWVRFEVTRRDAYIAAAALPMGMGLAHHVTMVYLLPAAALYLALRRPAIFARWVTHPAVRLGRLFSRGLARHRRFDGSWVFPVACLVGALPLFSYGYLVWANANTDGVPWGDVNSLDRVIDHATGKQYRKFLGGAEMASRWARLAKVPGFFDQQFFQVGTALFALGLGRTFRRASRFGVFLLATVTLNVGHGLYYSVGDYANYYIPALIPCSLLIGVGYASAAGFLRDLAPESRLFAWLASLSGIAAVAASLLLAYAKLTKRMPPVIAGGRVYWVVVPLALLAVASAAAASFVVVRRHRRPMPAWAGPALLGAAMLGALLPISLARAEEVVRRPLIGESYGEELAENMPAGSVHMTMGDGYLFTMWYEAHVHGRGTSVATLDMGNLKTPWYQRYVRSRYPRSCDPLLLHFVVDPAAYQARCGTFRKRIELGDKEAWVSLGQRTPARGTARELGPPLGDQIARGADAACADPEYERAHSGHECRCWGYEKRRGTLGETCVYSAEEGGVVPRDAVEILAQRIIEDHIDERPIFERNTLTNWIGNQKENPRRWSGPAYQRVSAEYAIVNRGRYNQIVYAADIAELDPSRPALERIRTRPHKPPARGARPRRPYQTNEWPTLVSATYLSASRTGTDDDASRHFRAGDEVFMKLDWFEQWTWDAKAEDKRGAPVRHGLRVFVFDPSGAKVGGATTVSGKGDRLKLLETKPASKRGEYVVQACTVGAIGDREVDDRDGCKRIMLEYTFVLGDDERAPRR